MGFNIKNNYGPNIEVNEGGVVNLHQTGRARWEVDAEEAEVVEEGEGNEQPPLTTKIAACFATGLLSVNEPSRLYFLLLALWARRLLTSKEIPAFVRLVKEAYPNLVDEERTEEKVIYAVQNMNKKADKYFDTFIKDQSSMIAYIDLMYPKKNDGTRRKDCEEAVTLASNLYLALK
ncbi:MAG: hypothetical protein IJK15_00290 [Bacteroidaceae bacterium]|nr:hypothetical protein [Bacteroidaceae bacterium]